MHNCSPRDSYSYRLRKFEDTLAEMAMERAVVDNFVFLYGVPDSQSRALMWKLLLNYLPFDKSLWDDTLKANREVYETYVQELTVNPYKDIDESSAPAQAGEFVKADVDPLGAMFGKAAAAKAAEAVQVCSCRSQAFSNGELPPFPSSRLCYVGCFPQMSLTAPFRVRVVTPLSQEEDGAVPMSDAWAEYFKDNEIRDEIQKDVERTYSTFHFFQQRVNPLPESPLKREPAGKGKAKCKPVSGRPGCWHGRGRGCVLRERICSTSHSSASRVVSAPFADEMRVFARGEASLHPLSPLSSPFLQPSARRSSSKTRW